MTLAGYTTANISGRGKKRLLRSLGASKQNRTAFPCRRTLSARRSLPGGWRDPGRGAALRRLPSGSAGAPWCAPLSGAPVPESPGSGRSVPPRAALPRALLTPRRAPRAPEEPRLPGSRSPHPPLVPRTSTRRTPVTRYSFCPPRGPGLVPPPPAATHLRTGAAHPPPQTSADKWLAVPAPSLSSRWGTSASALAPPRPKAGHAPPPMATPPWSGLGGATSLWASKAVESPCCAR